MPTTSYEAGWNRPPDVYDVNHRRDRLNGDKYPGLWWRMRAKGPVVWELKMKQNGKDRSFTLDATTEREAISAWKIENGKAEKGVPVIPRGDLTLAAVAKTYFENLENKVKAGKRARKTKVTYTDNWELHLEPALGRVRISKLTPKQIIGLYADMTDDGYAQWTQCGVHTVLKGCISTAMREEWLVRSPLEHIDPDDLPSQQTRPDHEPRIFRNEELVALIKAANPLYRNALAVLAFTGMRISELCGLTWADVSLSGRVVDLRYALGKDDEGNWIQGPLKGRRTALTNLSKRKIELLDIAVEALEAQYQSEREKGFGRDSDFVFTTTGGSGFPITPDNLRARGAKRAGEDAGLGHVRPHDFRHTCASILAAAEVPDTAAAAMMGHTVTVYRKTYVKAFEDAKERQMIREALTAFGIGHIRTVAE
jgi:integrase